MEEKPVPQPKLARKPVPQPKLDSAAAPSTLDAGRSVTLGKRTVEIQPTKTKYFRSQWANGHVLLQHYTLSEIFALTQERDGVNGDDAIFKFLVSVFDDEQLVKAAYDDMDSALLYHICDIFRSVNKINEIEDHQKNLMAANRANS